MFLSYPCTNVPTITPDNREYTVIIIIIIIIMTDLGIEFFEIRSLHCMCSEVSARVDFLLNIFKLSDSSLLGYYVLLSGKELPMFRGVF